jgi:hypothetical protein
VHADEGLGEEQPVRQPDRHGMLLLSYAVGGTI